MMPRAFWCAGAVVSAVLLVPAAHSSVFDLYGFEARGTALGNAMTTLADDYTATYYNPALLVLRRKVHLGASYHFAAPNLKIERFKVDSTIPNADAPNYSGVTVGMLFPVGHKIDYRLALGVAIYLPGANLLRILSVTPTTPHWYLYTSYPDKIQVLVGAAFRIVDELSIGAGIHTLAQAGGNARIAVDVVNKLVTQDDLDLRVSSRTALTAGVAWTAFNKPALGRFRIGASYRAALALDFSLPVALNLEGIGMIDLDVRGVVQYSPHQVNFGMSYQLPSERLRLALDLTYALWAYAPNPTVQYGINLTGDLITKLGFEKLLNLSTINAPLGAANIVIPRFGVEYDVNDVLKLRAGYFFRPTAIPRQTEPQSNYVDSKAHVFAFGAGFTFADPLEMNSNPLTIDIGFQFTFLPRRTAIKTDPNDPAGDHAGSGFVFNVVAGLRHDF